MAEQSEREHEEDLDQEEFSARFGANLIRKLTGQGVGEFILDMVQKKKLTLEELEPVLDKLPSSPETEWERVALSFDLNPEIDKYQLRLVAIPNAYLPPSFHERVMKDSIQWLDVYQERGSPMKKAARLRLMDAVWMPVFNQWLSFLWVDLSLSGSSPCVPFLRAAWLIRPRYRRQKSLGVGLNTKFIRNKA